MNIENDQKYYSFCLSILNAFHLDSFTFFKNLTNGDDYETQFFYWINELYSRNISVDESTQFIFKARHLKTFYQTNLELPKKKNDSENSRKLPCMIDSLVKPLIIDIAS